MKLLKIVYIILGTLSLALGIIGIVVPGLPTTPFILLTAWLYIKGSDKMHKWLISNKIFGKYILNFELNKGMTMQSKIVSTLMMWTMIAISCTFFIESTTIRLVVIAMGVIGTSVMVFFLKTTKKMV